MSKILRIFIFVYFIHEHPKRDSYEILSIHNYVPRPSLTLQDILACRLQETTVYPKVSGLSR
jgi:hypothetical protein